MIRTEKDISSIKCEITRYYLIGGYAGLMPFQQIVMGDIIGVCADNIMERTITL